MQWHWTQIVMMVVLGLIVVGGILVVLVATNIIQVEGSDPPVITPSVTPSENVPSEVPLWSTT